MPTDLALPLWILPGPADQAGAFVVIGAPHPPPGLAGGGGRAADGLRAYRVAGAALERLRRALRAALADAPAVPPPDVSGAKCHAPSADRYRLSPRERDVLREMTRGLTQKQIAAALFIARPTVNKHVQRIYAKLGVRTAAAAVARAVREQIV